MMQPAELKELRQSANMSQAEMAQQIGMARETIGQMERGQAPIELRTELAVRFVVAQRPQSAARSPMVVQKDVADLLYSITTRGASPDDLMALSAHQQDWFAAAGSMPGLVVLQQLHGVIAAMLATPYDNPGYVGLVRDFRQLQAMWATLGPQAPRGSSLLALQRLGS